MAKPKRKSKITRTPTLPDSFVPPEPQEGDEYYRNGIFCFNITSMIQDIENDRCEFKKCRVSVLVWLNTPRDKSLVDEFVESADLSKPIIIAEISPDRLPYFPEDIGPEDWKLRGYNIVDGHHRIEKAIRRGIVTLDAYILPMESHIRYLYSGFDKYVEYWNDKCKNLC